MGNRERWQYKEEKQRYTAIHCCYSEWPDCTTRDLPEEVKLFPATRPSPNKRFGSKIILKITGLGPGDISSAHLYD